MAGYNLDFDQRTGEFGMAECARSATILLMKRHGGGYRVKVPTVDLKLVCATSDRGVSRATKKSNGAFQVLAECNTATDVQVPMLPAATTSIGSIVAPTITDSLQAITIGFDLCSRCMYENLFDTVHPNDTI